MRIEIKVALNVDVLNKLIKEEKPDQVKDVQGYSMRDLQYGTDGIPYILNQWYEYSAIFYWLEEADKIKTDIKPIVTSRPYNSIEEAIKDRKGKSQIIVKKKEVSLELLKNRFSSIFSPTMSLSDDEAVGFWRNLMKNPEICKVLFDFYLFNDGDIVGMVNK